MEALAKPDDDELALRDLIASDPTKLQSQFDLAELLVSKNRHEDSIDVLLDIIVIDRNWNEKKAYTLLMDVFSKLGAANEKVKASRKKLANIMF